MGRTMTSGIVFSLLALAMLSGVSAYQEAMSQTGVTNVANILDDSSTTYGYYVITANETMTVDSLAFGDYEAFGTLSGSMYYSIWTVDGSDYPLTQIAETIDSFNLNDVSISQYDYFKLNFAPGAVNLTNGTKYALVYRTTWTGDVFNYLNWHRDNSGGDGCIGFSADTVTWTQACYGYRNYRLYKSTQQDSFPGYNLINSFTTSNTGPNVPFRYSSSYQYAASCTNLTTTTSFDMAQVHVAQINALKQTSIGAGDIWLEMYSYSSGPNAQIAVSSNTFPAQYVSGAGEYVLFNFSSPVSLTQNQIYCFVVKGNNSLNSNNYLRTVDGTEASSTEYVYNGATWNLDNSGNAMNYRLFQSSQLYAYDYLGKYNGTVSGTQLATGKANDALNFTGVATDNVTYETTNVDTFQNMTGRTITVAAWIYQNSDVNGIYFKNILSTGDSNTGYQFGLVDDYPAVFSGNVYVATGGVWASSTPLAANQWYHVVWVVDFTGSVTIYVDGVSQSTTAACGGGITEPALPETTTVLYTGGQSIATCGGYYDNSLAFDGVIDELGFWNRSINQTEVDELYNSGSGLNHTSISAGTMSGLLAYWPFDQVMGQYVPPILPTVTNLAIHPLNNLSSTIVRDNEDATVTYNTSNFNGTDQSIISWYVDGNFILTGSNITKDQYKQAQNLSVVVTPYDGITYGDNVTTSLLVDQVIGKTYIWTVWATSVGGCTNGARAVLYNESTNTQLLVSGCIAGATSPTNVLMWQVETYHDDAIISTYNRLARVSYPSGTVLWNVAAPAGGFGGIAIDYERNLIWVSINSGTNTINGYNPTTGAVVTSVTVPSWAVCGAGCNPEISMLRNYGYDLLLSPRGKETITQTNTILAAYDAGKTAVAGGNYITGGGGRVLVMNSPGSVLRELYAYNLSTDGVNSGALLWTYTIGGSSGATQFKVRMSDNLTYGIASFGSTGPIYVMNMSSGALVRTHGGTTYSFSSFDVNEEGESLGGGNYYEPDNTIRHNYFYGGTQRAGVMFELETIPVAGFFANQTNITVGTTVQFTDESLNAPTFWSWDLDGDNVSDSSEQDPQWTYSTPGTYTVTLTASNNQGSDDEIKVNYITVNAGVSPPVANFTANQTSGYAPLTVSFTDTSTNTPTTWAWDFQNDGIIDNTTQNPVFKYSTPGNYTVNLTASNGGGSDEEVKVNYIQVLQVPPVANFTVNQTIGLAPLSVQFSDLSTDYAIMDSSTGATGPDNYYGYDSTYNWTCTQYIPSLTYYLGAFGADIRKQGSPTGIHNLILRYGDPTNLTGQVVSSDYPESLLPSAFGGEYPIFVFPTNPQVVAGEVYWICTQSTTPENNVNYFYWEYGGSNPAYFETNGYAALGYNYKAYEAYPISSWAWDFNNDGIVDNTTQNPVYTYSSVGFYTVNLTVTNAGGSDTEIKTNYVRAIYGDSRDVLPGLTAYYKFDSGYTDSTGSHHASNVGGVSISTDSTSYLMGNSSQYTGAVNSYLTVSGDLGNSLNTTSVNVWVKVNNTNPRVVVSGFDAGNGAPDKGFELSLNRDSGGSPSANKILWGNDMGGGGSGQYVAVPANFSDNAWHMITVTLDSSNELKFYLDGAQINVQNTTSSKVSGGNSYAIGRRPTNSNWFFTNNMDGLGVWSRVLTQVEVTSLYNTGYGCQYNWTNCTYAPPPVANFTANVTSGYAPLSVQFTDTSTGSPTTWAWDFQNDGIVDNTTQNPIYTYSAPGTYTVNLTATNVGGSDSEVKSSYIQVNLLITAPVVSNQVCSGIVYPNEKDLPNAAQIYVNFTVSVQPNFTNNSYVAYLQRSSRLVNLTCSESGNSTAKNFNCTVPMKYYYEPGSYSLHVNYTNYGLITNSTSTNLCQYGQLLAMQKTTPVLTFPGAGPGINNVQSSDVLSLENTGNVDFTMQLTGYDLTGRSTPGSMLNASSFKAGQSIGSAVTLANGVTKNLSITVPAGASSNESTYLWLSMPSTAVPQDYYSVTPWQIGGTS